MMRRLLALLVLVCLGAGIAALEVRNRWEAPLAIPEEGFTLIVAGGDTLRTVAAQMHEAGVLAEPLLLRLYGRWTGLDQQVKQGEYLLPHGTTAHGALYLMQRGEVVQYKVTLPEGITLARAIEILNSQEHLQAVLSGAEDPRLLAMAAPHDHPEGLFFPDSYQYTRGESDLDILTRAHAAMQSILAEEWNAREESLPYENAYEALIMASIIERETGLPAERGQIAGVFVRRLNKGMLLQTDPTIIYGLGAEFDGNLRRSHLRDSANPYNTYRHKGLPPTPIALPGRAAIHAALHPEEGKALYFVARGDGGHVFSATLAEHNRAVRKYQLQRRKDYRSTPASKE